MLLIAIIHNVLFLSGSAAATLPGYLRWVDSVAPLAAFGPALKEYFSALPAELCNMGPEALQALPNAATDEVSA